MLGEFMPDKWWCEATQLKNKKIRISFVEVLFITKKIGRCWAYEHGLGCGLEVINCFDKVSGCYLDIGVKYKMKI